MTTKTSLRNFQSEIDQIRHREVARQRDQAAAERAKEKEVKKTPVRTAAEPPAPVNGDGGDLQIKDPAGLSDVDERIQSLLLSASPADHDKARDIVASLLTRHKGEYILRFGAHPPHPKLFSKLPGSLEDSDGWRGSALTAEELDTLQREVKEILTDIGGVVCVYHLKLSILYTNTACLDYGAVRHKNKSSSSNIALTITSRGRLCHAGGTVCCRR